MWRNIRLAAIILIVASSLNCSTNPSNDTKSPANDSKPIQKTEDAPTPIKPSLGEISITLPKGWMLVEQSSFKAKDKEVYSFTRKIDQKLWANPGPLGTGTLPVMSMTITLRDAKASRDDIKPQNLGNALVKQKVFTELVKAEELRVANMPATSVVGDTVQRGRTTIVMLPNNGYLYKWTLDGTRAEDPAPADDFEIMLTSAQLMR